MTWKRRLYLYTFGLGIGLLITWMFFWRDGKRDIGGWLPDNRVVTFLTAVPEIKMDSSLKCVLSCNGIDQAKLREGLLTAEVNFDKSQPQKEPCREYLLTLTAAGKKLDGYFEACMTDSTARLLKVQFAQGSTSCDCK